MKKNNFPVLLWSLGVESKKQTQTPKKIIFILWKSKKLYKESCHRSSKLHCEIDFELDSWSIMIFLISSKLYENAKSTLMDLKCQFYDDLNRFHAFWADFVFFFREMLANNHVMGNELRDLLNFLSFQPKCPFRWKI